MCPRSPTHLFLTCSLSSWAPSSTCAWSHGSRGWVAHPTSCSGLPKSWGCGYNHTTTLGAICSHKHIVYYKYKPNTRRFSIWCRLIRLIIIITILDFPTIYHTHQSKFGITKLESDLPELWPVVFVDLWVKHHPIIGHNSSKVLLLPLRPPAYIYTHSVNHWQVLRAKECFYFLPLSHPPSYFHTPSTMRLTHTLSCVAE